jgi:hypothetical protein
MKFLLIILLQFLSLLHFVNAQNVPDDEIKKSFILHHLTHQMT